MITAHSNKSYCLLSVVVWNGKNKKREKISNIQQLFITERNVHLVYTLFQLFYDIFVCGQLEVNFTMKLKLIYSSDYVASV